MKNLVTYFGVTICPGCGQEARIVRRQVAIPRHFRAPESRLSEQCMECMLKTMTQEQQRYQVAQWRLLWHFAGGTDADMPRYLREDGKRYLPVPVRTPVHMQALVAGDHACGTTPAGVPVARPMPHRERPPRRPMRVLFVSHDLDRSGAPIILLRLATHLRNVDATIYAMQGTDLLEDCFSAGIPVTGDLELQQYDLVVANTLLSASVVAKCRAAGVPCIWLIHEYVPDLCANAAEVQDVIHYPRFVVYPHESTAKNYEHWRQDGIAIVPTVVPRLPLLDRTTCRFDLGIKDDDFLVVTLGKDEPRKGHADIRQATAGLPFKVAYVSDSHLALSFLAAADVYVSASRMECFPLAVQEAKAYGVPVVATAIGGNLAVLRKDEDALMYQVGDVEQLRKLLWRLKDDEALRERLSRPLEHLPSYDATLGTYERLMAQAAGWEASGALQVVYHVCSMGRLWKAIVHEQLDCLRKAGLRRVLCTHVGQELAWLLDEAGRMGMELLVCDHRDRLDHYERPAIELIERLVRVSDDPILYLHSKGVSHEEPTEMYHDWRRLMQNALVPQWRQWVTALQEYDAVGVNWWSAADKGHFSGNFWMARASWLRGLLPMATYYRDRYSCERWIGSVSGCKALSLLCQDAAFWDRDRALFNQLLAAQRSACEV